MKTVLHLSSSSGPGGAERIACALASSLDRGKYRSLVGLFRPGWLKDQCESRGLVTYVLPSHGFMHWRWMRECYRLVREEKVDLIHAHEFDANVHGMVVAAFAGIPMVATVHGRSYFWEKARRRAAYRLVSRYAQMVAVSEDLKRFLIDQVGIRQNRVQVIYNGVDESAGFDRNDVAQYKKDLGVPHDDMVVGVIGNLYPIKGHTYLLQAIPQILRTCPQTSFLFIGRGELEVPLKTQVKELGVEEKVRFLGLRQDIPTLLSVMDIFAMPSLSEGLSIALLEAMAAAKPVVATDVGGNPELVASGETGLLVPPSDADALAMKICELLQNRELASSLGANALAKVNRDFTVDAMITKYERLYETHCE
jgi:glycosyltransferase involved in cell wall biosynthesis